MRAVIQRVLQAEVVVEGRTAGRIDQGVLVYLGVAKGDSIAGSEYIAEKIVNLRIFPDEAGKMNRSIIDVGGSILLISNFTLCGDCRKGRRPSFDGAAKGAEAEQLYEKVAESISRQGVKVARGVFAAHMHVESINDGPVTFVIDSP